MRKNDSIYLRHILDSIERIEEYTRDMEKEGFSSSNLGRVNSKMSYKTDCNYSE
ncbi:ribonuclease HepT family protein [Methanosarcina barkeri]|uniref:Nucleotidyltransferase n=1 Tax=Methanosarcina barkeri CM1 TaxID=796385 RepID=A0A0G3CHH0_METBA|nr:hypothetical protein [Methanosarcina barkeri]AKJ40145.1 nucleotidyltransferase [Methanosarcina barkeri CM1]